MPGNTLSHLHFNGTDGSKTFTDEKGLTWTPRGTATPELDTAQKYFGTASGLWGSLYGPYLDTPWAACWNLGNCDWTFECFIRPSSAPSNYGLLHVGPTIGADSFAVVIVNATTIRVRYGGTNYDFTVPTIAANTWYHLGITHDNAGQTINVYANGTGSASNPKTVTEHPSTDSGVTTLGYDSSTGCFRGWIDEFRMSDIVRWTGDFTVPTAEYDSMVIVEAEIAAGSGVKAEFDAIHLVESLDAHAGVKAEMDGVILRGDVEARAGTRFETDGYRLREDLDAAAGIKAEFGTAGSDYSTSVWAEAGIRAEMEPIHLVDQLPAQAGIGMSLARTIEAARSVTAGCGIAADFDGYNWSDFLRTYRDRITIRYILTLSDGILDDIDIPISSFQGRFRSGDPSFLSVVVPGNDQYEAIAERDQGDMILTMQYCVDGAVFHSEVLCTVDLEEIRLDHGSVSASVTLSGHRTVTHFPKASYIVGESYRSVYGGKVRYRCPPDLYMRPGDTVIIGRDIFVAGMVTWMVTPSSATMEIAEA